MEEEINFSHCVIGNCTDVILNDNNSVSDKCPFSITYRTALLQKTELFEVFSQVFKQQNDCSDSDQTCFSDTYPFTP